MADIPEYEGGFQSAALPTPMRKTSGAPGLEIAAQGLSRAKRVLDQAAVVADNSYISKARKAELDVAHELLNGEDGFYKQRGERAIGSSTRTMTEWKKQTDLIMDGLHNGRQKKKVREILDQRHAQLQRHTNSVELQETRSFNQANHASTMTEILRSAASLGMDDDAFQGAIEQGNDELVARAEVTGMTQEVLDDALAEFQSTAVLAAAQELNDNGFGLRAKDFYDTWERLIIPTAGSQLKNQIQSEVDNKMAQAKAVELLEDVDVVTAEIEQAGYDEIDKITDQDLQDKTRTRYKIRVADINGVHETELAENYELLADMLEANGGDYDGLPASRLAKTTRNQNINLMTYAEKIRGKDTPVATDWDYFFDNWHDKTQEERGNIQLRQFQGRVSEGLFRQMQREQDQINKGEAAVLVPDEFSYPKFERLWKKVAYDLKLDPKSSQMSRAFYNTTADLADRPVSDDDMRTAIDEAMQTVTKSGRGWGWEDDEVIRGSLTDEDIKGGKYFSSVEPTASHFAAVKKYLKKGKVPYHDDAVRAVLFQEQEGLAPAVTDLLKAVDIKENREQKERQRDAAEAAKQRSYDLGFAREYGFSRESHVNLAMPGMRTSGPSSIPERPGAPMDVDPGILEVPGREVRKIREIILGNGWLPTDELIVEIYNETTEERRLSGLAEPLDLDDLPTVTPVQTSGTIPGQTTGEGD